MVLSGPPPQPLWWAGLWLDICSTGAGTVLQWSWSAGLQAADNLRSQFPVSKMTLVFGAVRAERDTVSSGPGMAQDGHQWVERRASWEGAGEARRGRVATAAPGR